MAIEDEITKVQSFAERTLKYGRNMMAAAVPIIVFYFVPLVDLARSRPFNFEIQEGGEIWIWRILLALLVYYGFRFFGLAIPDFLKWRNQHGESRANIKSRLIGQINNEKARRDDLASAHQAYDTASDNQQRKQLEERIFQVEKKVGSAQKAIREIRSELRDYNWRRTYFWIADAGLPTSLFVLTLWASLDQIFMLRCLEIPLNCAGGETP